MLGVIDAVQIKYTVKLNDFHCDRDFIYKRCYTFLAVKNQCIY